MCAIEVELNTQGKMVQGLSSQYTWVWKHTISAPCQNIAQLRKRMPVGVTLVWGARNQDVRRWAHARKARGKEILSDFSVIRKRMIIKGDQDVFRAESQENAESKFDKFD
ncbi:hypothetical protein BDN70DRAFT_898987 [Pholiota conissans]|uniref:Uncharacterized protein n=1 Tax=Pholiota conissans TaxID=109636 RepID=A0A9P5YR97_9AGAR|nr:hypothetical protein BDN70DRAFT_898987 [Pholiota conissans]